MKFVPVDLKKSSEVVKKKVVKITVYDQLVKNVIAIQTIDTSDLVRITECNTKINDIENKINDHDHSNKYITTQDFNKLTS